MKDGAGLPLRTKRLAIREFRRTDEAAIHRYASDPEVVRYMVWGPNTAEQTRRFLEEKIAAQRRVPRLSYELAVDLRRPRTMIGACRLGLDEGRRSGDIGYVLSRRYWGRGLMTEVIRAFVAFAFERFRLHRVWATCDVRNRASARVMEKVGMRREGRMRQHVWEKGEWRDSYLYAILEDERPGTRSGR